MIVTLLGTGCPQVHAHRFGPASLVRSGGPELPGRLRLGRHPAAGRGRESGAALDAVLLTHLHSDHVVDLYQLIVSSWHQGRDRPQRIFGPPGTRRFAEATMALWQRERELRIAWECRPSIAALELEITEFEEGTSGTRTGSDQRLRGRSPPGQAGVRLSVRERARSRVAFSGDTTVCDRLVRAAAARRSAGPRMLHPPADAATTRRARRRGLANVAAYHTLSSEVGKVASRAGASCCSSTTSFRSSSIATHCCARSRPTSPARS